MGLKPNNPTLPLLEKELPDILEHHEKGILNIIPVHTGAKAPMGNDWQKSRPTIEKLERHNGNFGVVIGYNHENNGYSIAVADIDGFGNGNEEIKKKTQQLIFNDLKDIPNTIQVRTQSGGYHIYFLNKTQYDKIHETSQCLHFPLDFEIEELQGKSLNKAIEIFTKTASRQTVLPSSVIIKEGKITGEYTVINENNLFSKLEPISDINQTIKEHLMSKGYTFKEPAIKKIHSNYETLKTGYPAVERKCKQLDEKEIDDLTKLLIKCYIQGNKNHSKHDMTLAISGICDKYLDDKTITAIGKNIVANNGNGYDIENERLFITTLWANVDGKTHRKAGIPTLKRLLQESGLNERTSDNIIAGIYKIVGDKYEQLKDGRGNNYGLTVPLLSEDEKYRITKGISEKLKSEKISKKYIKNALEGIIFTLAINGIALNDIEEISQEIFEETKNLKELVYEKWMNFDTENLSDDISQKIHNINAQIQKIIRNYAPVKLKELRNSGYAKQGFNPLEVADYLNKYCGVAINDIDGLPIIYNPQYNRYDTISYKNLYKYFVQEILQIPNCISENDIYSAVTYITDWITPNWNVIGLKNCNYDFETHSAIEKFPKPTFPAFTFKWNYNPSAKPIGIHNIIEFLKSSLKGATKTETNRNVKGLLELLGYFLKAGNERQIVLNCVGVGGSGKGTLEKIITALFGAERTSNVGINEYEEEFGRSSLIGSWINIDTDATSETLNSCSYFKKSISDPLKIERKFKEPVVLPPQAVPKNIIMSNTAVKFKNESNLFGKFIIIEFLHSYRNTSNVVLNYDKIITENETDMEWLLFNSLEAFKEMDTAENGDFIYRLSNDETEKKMQKYQDPVGYILRTLIEPIEAGEVVDHHIVYVTDLDNAIIKTAEEMGLEISLTPSGKVRRLRNAIAEMVDLPVNEVKAIKETDKRHYPNIKWLDNQTKWYFDN